MTYSLFLDDERHPKDVKWIELPLTSWVIVRNFAEFVSTIKSRGAPAEVSFDHDLADAHYTAMLHNHDLNKYGPEKTGLHCAKWLVEYCHDMDQTFPRWTVHSLNPVGAQAIRDYIESAESVGFITIRT